MNFEILEMQRNSNGDVMLISYSVTKSANGHTAYIADELNFTPNPSASDYVPYDSLTEEMVVGWLKNCMDLEAIEAGLDRELASKENPLSSGKPW